MPDSPRATPTRPDLAALASGVSGAQSALAEAEAAAHRAEAAHRAGERRLDAARGPLTAAERTVQRLETEAKTIGKLLAVESKNLWPPVMDAITVAESYEKALGAALGDDLDAPVDPSAPMHWAGAAADPTDPALPDGRRGACRNMSKRRAELARRLAQIGVVDRADGATLAALLKPGQRLVSREGDLWRWDGFAAAAHAPTGAARRLAERGRLQAIESELDAARIDVEGKRARGRSRARRRWPRLRCRNRSPRRAGARRSVPRTRRARPMPPPNARSAAMPRASPR